MDNRKWIILLAPTLVERRVKDFVKPSHQHPQKKHKGQVSSISFLNWDIFPKVNEKLIFLWQTTCAQVTVFACSLVNTFSLLSVAHWLPFFSLNHTEWKFFCKSWYQVKNRNKTKSDVNVLLCTSRKTLKYVHILVLFHLENSGFSLLLLRS